MAGLWSTPLILLRRLAGGKLQSIDGTQEGRPKSISARAG